MRVISVVTRLNIGGVTPPVLSLVSGFSERGHDSCLVTGVPTANEGSMEGEAVKLGIPLIRVEQLQREVHPRRDAHALTRLVQIFRERRPDAVCTHMAKAGALGRIAARLVGVPVVVHTYHGQGFQVFDARWKRQFAAASERMLARLSSGNIVVSELQRQMFVRMRIGPPKRLRVIRYGLDLEPFLSAENLPRTLRSELGLPGARLVGVVARVVAMKGQDVFLRAAAQLARRYADVYFIIVGDGDDRVRFERLAGDLNVADRVRFIGWRRDIPYILANLDIIVLPTVLNFEGVPLALIEAMATRRPVVATRVGGVPELIRTRETGLLVEPRDAIGLEEAIGYLLDHPSFAQNIASAGQALVAHWYRRDRMVQETEGLLEELLQEGGRLR